MAKEERKLRRKLNLLDVTSITAGIVVGAGLFIVTGVGAKYAGSWVWLSYLIGVIPVVLVGLSTASLAQMYPVESGESYIYPTRIISKLFGFLSGWGMWFAIIGPVAITAKAFVQYLNALPQIGTVFPVVAGAVIVTLIFFVINYLGVKTVAWLQNVLFLFMVAGVAVFIVWALPHLNRSLLAMKSPYGFNGIIKGSSILIFSYAGLTLAADLGEETKNPKKTIPYGIMLGAFIPMVLYTLFALVCVGVMPWGDFAAASAPGAAAAKVFMGPAGVTFLCVVAWAAVLSSHNGEQATAARISFGLSRDKVITGKLADINRFGIPHYALIASAAIAIFLIVTGTLELLATIIVSMFLYNWIITHLALIVVQKKFPEMYEKTPFKLNGWKLIVPIIGLIISVILLVYQGWVALSYAAIWMIVGAIVYFIGYSRNKEEVSKLMSEWPVGRYLK
ncbi:MAG: APC family permease [Candidatus Aerophobetes bacterium]|nr:APC family permease [Candidatus Aerophobetes bacterium]